MILPRYVNSQHLTDNTQPRPVISPLMVSGFPINERDPSVSIMRVVYRELEPLSIGRPVVRPSRYSFACSTAHNTFVLNNSPLLIFSAARLYKA
jgi:hypothetical protein